MIKIYWVCRNETVLGHTNVDLSSCVHMLSPQIPLFITESKTDTQFFCIIGYFVVSAAL